METKSKLLKYIGKIIILIVILSFIRCIFYLNDYGWFNNGWRTVLKSYNGKYIIEYQERPVLNDSDIRIKVSKKSFIPKTLAMSDDYDLMTSLSSLTSDVCIYWVDSSEAQITISDTKSDRIFYNYIVKLNSDDVIIYKE